LMSSPAGLRSVLRRRILFLHDKNLLQSSSSPGHPICQRLPPLIPHSTHRRFKPPTETVLGQDGWFDDVVDLFTGKRRYVLKTTPTAVLVFAAFSCLNNGGYNSRGFLALVDHISDLDTGIIGPLATRSSQEHTSNRAALGALLLALRREPWPLLGFTSVIVAMNSQYVVDGFADGVDRWRENGWTINSGRPVSNQDLWEEVLEIVQFWERFGVDIFLWNVRKETNSAANASVRTAPVRRAGHPLSRPLH
jgi:ribonuclease HI